MNRAELSAIGKILGELRRELLGEVQALRQRVERVEARAAPVGKPRLIGPRGGVRPYVAQTFDAASARLMLARLRQREVDAS